MTLPHPDQDFLSVCCAIITISDTRTFQTDKSGQLIQQRLTDVGHVIGAYLILPDEPHKIQSQLQELSQNNIIDGVIFNGGTGISPRDTTYDVLSELLDKTLPGFGELFRFLSYQEIGSRAMASRAIAGIYQNKLIFSLPGSSNAVKLGLDKLILPELIHLIKQLRGT
ncbi:MogA/MoaB family molybdenum cofactor biosynthesis protein [Aphanothece sacrum]|uniref:Molybdenum cofactor biosynthesis protein B n=1 Tax=Aphanothece sacrum FPU1 TaxID=1920663 RepID=A0A401ILP3_APHSA|nr:MogA/MoaB family molybdenum cofactor biosynthesis protein [Aphanothece sacrum]GBF82165.1 molybdenum cofactor synthesis domain protein [Aphanothece sacrum FPU1]GBF85876.1 molybdenum cofactor synthesis domain protein [Aphanothece sacrum FPU3]